MSISRIAAAVAALGLAAAAHGQQPAPPATPAFPPADLSPEGVRALVANCAACHGTEGRAASDSAVSNLAGMSAKSIRDAMAQFKSGARPATVMHQLAKGYADAEMAAVAEYFSKVKAEGRAP